MNFSKIVVLVGCLFVFGSSIVSASGTMDELLYNAVANNNVALAQTALAGGASVNGVQGDGHTTPLVLAVRNNSTVMVEYLLAHGADPNQAVNGGPGAVDTPLIFAVRNDNLQIAQILVKAGADVNISREMHSGGRHYLDYFPGSGDGATPLLFAIITNEYGERYLPMVQFLVSKGADVNKANNYGYTPLMAVANVDNAFHGRQSCYQIAKVLLAAGANPAKKDKDGRTALQYAIGANFTDMINLLLPISPK